MGLAGPLASLAVGSMSVGMAALTAQLDVTRLVPVALLWIGASLLLRRLPHIQRELGDHKSALVIAT